MDEFDLTGLNVAMPYSAYQIAKDGVKKDALNRARAKQEAKRDNAILQTAEVIEQQLVEIKQQNAQLKENYKLLNDLYSRAKQDAEDGAKDARKSRIFGWVSFAVGTFIGVAGIVLGIIF